MKIDGIMNSALGAAALFAAILFFPPVSQAARVSLEPLKGMALVLVAGGSYERGDFTGRGLPLEQPPHVVSISDFYLSRHEVTVGQFRRFVDETGYLTEVELEGGAVDIDSSMKTFVYREGVSWHEPGFVQSEDSPVVWVSWNDAASFASWLAEKTSTPYRLPTEAEWEYAAREGGEQRQWSGTASFLEVARFAWFASNSFGGTRPVGSKEPNGFGLYDMSGNVWEWCSDWQEPYSRSGEVLVDPRGPEEGKFRVLRGGSWRVGQEILRTTYRNGYRPDYAHGSIGFRLAISAEMSESSSPPR